MNSLLKTQPKADSPAFLAAKWLLESGIQDKTKDDLTYGGVNAWYDVAKDTYPFVYSEITGYAVNSFLHSYTLTQEETYLEASKSAADCLLANRNPETGLVFNRIWHEGEKQDYFESWIFAFDQWVIVYGLACLYEVVKESKYLEAAERMAQFLMTHVTRESGDFLPVYDFEKMEAAATYDKWSRQPGSFHAKALMAFQKLYEVTSKADYLEAAKKLAGVTLKLQQDDGRFVTQDNEGSTHLHPHIYTLEGLLSFGLAHKDSSILESVEKGIQWVLSHQQSNGTIYSFYQKDAFVPFVRCDILAQTLRVGSVLQQQDRLKGYDKQLEALRAQMMSYQVKEGAQKGGFFYGQEQDGTIHYHVNAWVSMFAAQALWIYDFRNDSSESYNMNFFV